MSGKFVTFEGIDGAGKSTYLAWFADRLRARGVDVVVTREPGGTALGEKLRELLLHEPMNLETETLLMFAARKEHLERLIMPSLQLGKWVISDRFTDATFAYQGGGRGLGMAKIAALEQWVHPNIQPDLTIVFDAPVEVAAARLTGTGNAPDRFECESTLFFERVRAVYHERGRQFPSRIVTVDSNRTAADIQKELEYILSRYCN